MRITAGTLMLIMVALLSLGAVMLASTSSARAMVQYGDADYFVRRQLMWMAMGLMVGLCALHFDYHLWQKAAVPLAVLTLVLLALVFVPGIGVEVKGSKRWVKLVGSIRMQPSELAKVALVIVMSWWMNRIGRRAREFRKGFLKPFLCLVAASALVLAEEDFGTTLLLGTVGMLIMFVGGSGIFYLSAAGLLGAACFAVAVRYDPVRFGRIMSFIRPEEFPDLAYHLEQSKLAFIKGGLFGVGLGKSIQKQFYLPEAHTDFILPIIGEELGFLATILVLLAFAGILACGAVICRKAPDNFGRLLAFGMTMMLTIQAAINVGVVTGCLPTKGLPLPFISYGGSSVVASIVCVCVLLNVAEHGRPDRTDVHTRFFRDTEHQFV